MDAIEKVGKTVEEAVDAAVAELGVTREQIEYQVIEEPSKGLFGFLGGKPARVRVVLIKEAAPDAEKQVAPETSVRREKGFRQEAADQVVAAAKVFLINVFTTMKINVKMERLTHEDHVTINLRGDDLGILIGKHGQTLDALQYLTNLAAHRECEERVKIVLDVEDYRKRREETLARLARRLAERVRMRGERVVLEPMSPHERKVIHTTLQNDSRVVTFSEGEEPFRKVVIALRK